MQNHSPLDLAAANATSPVEDARSPRVVVVDDSEEFRVVICELLKMLFDVEIVGVGTNGFEALELTAEQGPDLLIMDVHMPVLDGISAASLISTHFPATTILLMSADESPEIRDRCFFAGARAFSPKATIGKQISNLQMILDGERSFSGPSDSRNH